MGESVRRNRMTIGAVVSGVLVFNVFSAFADNVYFTNADGSGDLSSPGAWNVSDKLDSDNIGRELTPSDRLLFGTCKEGTFTTSKDISAGSMQIQVSSGCTNTFKFANERRLTLSGGLSSYYKSSHVTFSGGNWSIGGKLTIGSGRSGQMFFLTNGVNVSANEIQYSTASTNCLCGVYGTGDSSRPATLIQTKKDCSLFSAGVTNCVFEVMNGGSLVTKGGWLTTSSDNCKGNIFRVSGEGSAVSTETDASTLQVKGWNNRILISDKAVLSLNVSGGKTGSASFGNSDISSGNALEIFSGGKLIGGTFDVNKVEKSYGNSIYVTDGGTFDISGTLLIGGSGGSEILVSNATLKCSNFQIGTVASSTGNIFRVTGDSVLDTPYKHDSWFDIFGAGSENRFILDGVIWDSPLGIISFNYNNRGSSNRVEVINGGEIKAKGFIVGYNVESTRGNVLYIGEDSCLSVTSEVEKAVAVMGADNRIVVSNGTIKADIDYKSIMGVSEIVSSARESNVGEGNAVVLQGTKPKIHFPSGTLRFADKAVLRFELDKAGYEAVPVETDTFTMSDGSILEIDCEEFQQNLSEKARLTLVKSKKPFSLPDGMLAAVNEKLLPLNSMVYLDEDDTALKLKVAPEIGFRIIIR